MVRGDRRQGWRCNFPLRQQTGLTGNRYGVSRVTRDSRHGALHTWPWGLSPLRQFISPSLVVHCMESRDENAIPSPTPIPCRFSIQSTKRCICTTEATGRRGGHRRRRRQSARTQNNRPPRRIRHRRLPDVQPSKAAPS